MGNSKRAAVISCMQHKLDFPIPVKEVRVADEPLHAVARGCLLMALAE